MNRVIVSLIAPLIAGACNRSFRERPTDSTMPAGGISIATARRRSLSATTGRTPSGRDVRVFRKNEGYGFIDTTGREVVPCSYTDATDYENGEAVVKRRRTHPARPGRKPDRAQRQPPGEP